MATFKDRIEDYIGTVTDTTALDEWLTEEARKLYSLLPIPKASAYATTLTDSGSGVSIANSRVLGANKSGVISREIPYNDKAKYSDSNSIFYAHTNSPVHYFNDGKAYVLPNGGEVLALSYPAVSNTDTSLTIKEAEEALVLGVAIKALFSFLNSDKESLDSLSLDSIVKPIAPASPSFTYTSATAEVLNSTTISVSSSLPTYTKPIQTADFSNAENYISAEEDFEKAQTEIQQQRAKIEKHQNDLYNELNQFNQEAKAYELELQKAIAQAQLTQQRLMDDAQRADNIELANRAKELEKEVSEYRGKLERYAQEVQKYIGEVNHAVQKYSLELQKIVSKVNAYAKLFEVLAGKYKEALEYLIRS